MSAPVYRIGESLKKIPKTPMMMAAFRPIIRHRVQQNVVVIVDHDGIYAFLHVPLRQYSRA
jgi:hypothetical protein